jgi:threonine synthase
MISRVHRSFAPNDKSLVSYCVPTGNFGNILAGYYAKQMGLPIGKLVVCTNENDVLHRSGCFVSESNFFARFIQTGIYHRTPSRVTIAPSMDISISSNFERYLYYLTDEDADQLSSWMRIFESTGDISVGYNLLHRAQQDFSSSTSSEQAILEAIKSIWNKESYLLCPHSAIAVHTAISMDLVKSHTICLATAHPAKFENVVRSVIPEESERPEIPCELEEIRNNDEKKYYLPCDVLAIKKFIRNHVGASKDEKEFFLITVGCAILLIIVLFSMGGHTKHH